MTDVELAVADAADWLDRTEPGWADRVNVDDLRIDSSAHCVLAQVFRGRSGTVTLPGRTAEYSGFAYGYYIAGGQDVHARHPTAYIFCKNATQATWVKAIAARTVQAVVVEPQPAREEERELVAV